MGSGSVYLKDWLNVDVPDRNTFLADERPDLVDRWSTTEADYYARHADKTQDALRSGPLNQEYVCDVYGSFLNLPPLQEPVDELLARQVWEHMSITEARAALTELYQAIRPGGILRIDVPDHEKTLELYAATRDPFYVRHLLGPRRNDYGFHLMSYTPCRLAALVEEKGFFRCVGSEENLHFYPAFCLRFERQ
jgi:hypothetical protein